MSFNNIIIYSSYLIYYIVTKMANLITFNSKNNTINYKIILLNKTKIII